NSVPGRYLRYGHGHSGIRPRNVRVGASTARHEVPLTKRKVWKPMKKATKEDFARASALRADGRNHREIMAETGLSHSQMERHFMAEDLASGVIAGGFWDQPDSQTAKAAMIAKARLAGESWGLISVRFNEPESRTRRCFTEAHGVDSKGMRIGKGG